MKLIYGVQQDAGKILVANELGVKKARARFAANASPGPPPGSKGEEQAVFPRLVFKELGLSGVLAPKRGPHLTLGPWRLSHTP